MNDHAPDSQQKTDKGWRGQCRCGVRFSGKGLSDFQESWEQHLRDSRTETAP